MAEEWLTAEQAIAAIRKHIGGSEGLAMATLKRARASGEVRAEAGRVVLLMADDGLMGMSLRPGSKSTYDAPQPRLNADDLADWLQRNFELAAAKVSQLGAPEKFDWDDIEQFVRREIAERGDYRKPENRVKGWRSQNDLIRSIESYLSRTKQPVPSPTQFKKKLPNILRSVILTAH